MLKSVSKTFPIENILPLIEHGHLHYGENKVQELIRNVPADQLDPVAPTQIWEHASGFRSSPYADVRPAGSDIARSMRSAAKMAP